MKKWSIKRKIIFWYTLFLTILIGLDFAVIQIFSSQTIDVQASQAIQTATDEVAGLISFEDGNVYLYGDDDARFNFYHDGVIFVIYSNDQIAYGQLPSNFNTNEPIEIGIVKDQVYNGMDWLVYDVQIQNNYVLRGIYDISPLTNSISQLILVIGILSPTIVVFSAVGGYFIIKRSFRPIKKIYSTAASIKDEEDYTKRVPVDESKDEVHELAVMVNQMLDRVENSINREKRFSSNVSHELRTPLTVMLAQAEYMLDKAKDNKTKNEIETIISQINYMEKIVTQLLDITRAKRLSKEEMDQIDMYELIKFTKDTFAKYLEFKHITFNLIEPGFNTTIDANQTMMIRVFSNLISNAIKYNQENGSITIGFKKDDKQLVIDVDDTGNGISKDHLDKIFDPLYRADESRTQNDYSIGLGLSLVKEIIRQHNGNIQVESTPLKGTRFTVSLPFKTK